MLWHWHARLPEERAPCLLLMMWLLMEISGRTPRCRGQRFCSHSAKFHKAEKSCLTVTVQMDNDKMENSSEANSVTWWQPNRCAFQLPKTKVKGKWHKKKQQLNAAALKAWKGRSKEDTQHLMSSTLSTKMQRLSPEFCYFVQLPLSVWK